MQLPPFKNNNLLQQAFIHRSYLNESKKELSSNERLEFLGDSILSFIVSEYLFTTYPEFDEGTLTNIRSLLVNTKSLAQTAKELDFGNRLMLSKGEEEAAGRENQSLLADSLESFIGALFLDQGIQAVKKFLYDTLIPKTQEIVDKKSFKDPKSLFQEYTQAQNHASPLYKVLKEVGPSHAKVFTVGVFVHNQQMGQGQGRSKQEAEALAAAEALEKIGK